MNSPKYYRARIAAIEKLIAEQRDVENHAVLLRNGVIPAILKPKADKFIQSYKVDNERALDFMEITRYNNWFEMHPEKVAGKEIITTSIQFPLSIKGTREDIEAVINATLKGESKAKRLRIARARAKAKLKLLELIKV